MSKYQIVVGNLGTVYSGNDISIAYADWRAYCDMVELPHGRSSGESVALFINDEIEQEFYPSNYNFEEN
jgi:hypothetical protein